MNGSAPRTVGTICEMLNGQPGRLGEIGAQFVVTVLQILDEAFFMPKDVESGSGSRII